MYRVHLHAGTSPRLQGAPRLGLGEVRCLVSMLNCRQLLTGPRSVWPLGLCTCCSLCPEAPPDSLLPLFLPWIMIAFYLLIALWFVFQCLRPSSTWKGLKNYRANELRQIDRTNINLKHCEQYIKSISNSEEERCYLVWGTYATFYNGGGRWYDLEERVECPPCHAGNCMSDEGNHKNKSKEIGKFWECLEN